MGEDDPSTTAKKMAPITTDQDIKKEKEVRPRRRRRPMLSLTHHYMRYLGSKEAERYNEAIRRIRQGSSDTRFLKLKHSSVDLESGRERASIAVVESGELIPRNRRRHMSVKDFRCCQALRQGTFGKIEVVRENRSGRRRILRTIKKVPSYQKEASRVISVPRILLKQDSQWVVKLFHAFQDVDNFYFTTELLTGRSISTLLAEYKTFNEDAIRFYIAEASLAIQYLHEQGFIHHEIKPSNILIDEDGHVKLSHYGLSIPMKHYYDLLQYSNHEWKNATELLDDSDKSADGKMKLWGDLRKSAYYSTKRFPNYLSPEVLRGESNIPICDWWSLGTIMYEMICGYPPFVAPSPLETFKLVVNSDRTLDFDDSVPASIRAIMAVKRLCTDSKGRIGKLGLEEVKKLSFFSDVKWDRTFRIPTMIRRTRGPLVGRKVRIN